MKSHEINCLAMKHATARGSFEPIFPKMHPACLVFLVLFLIFPGLAAADVLLLKSGDRLSGTIEEIDPKNLTLQTPYADRLHIRREKIAAIQTDRPLRVTFASGTELEGTILPAYGGMLQLVTPDFRQTWEFRLTDIQTATRQTTTRATPPKAGSTKVASPVGAEAEKFEWKGRLNLGFSATGGNTDKENYHVDAETTVRMKRQRVKLTLEYNREKDNGRESEDNAVVSAKYDHFLTKQWFAFLNATVARDPFQDLALRTATGGGVGYQFFDTKKRRLSAEIGINYVKENFDNQANESYPSARWSIDYEEELFHSRMAIFHFQEGLLGLEDTSDLIIRTHTGLRFPLIHGFIATLQANIDWDNSPALDKTSTDKTYLLTLGYEW
ncbi:DUF481 domain-containing protein [Rhodospirillaceae bacterium AH-315-P19]|nr:DUF481 domain-containing protein [Rhodospirillaceae bacterium AH-315-P19]